MIASIHSAIEKGGIEKKVISLARELDRKPYGMNPETIQKWAYIFQDASEFADIQQG